MLAVTHLPATELPSTELPQADPAVVAHAAGDLRIENIPLTSPRPDQAVVEIGYGGICGSDLHYWLHGAAGESVLKAPMVLGMKSWAWWSVRLLTEQVRQRATPSAW